MDFGRGKLKEALTSRIERQFDRQYFDPIEKLLVIGCASLRSTPPIISDGGIIRRGYEFALALIQIISVMTNYRRNFLPGGTFFFTAASADRSSRLLVERIDDLRGAMQRAKQDMPFNTIAMVVMPDHLHCIWRLPEGDVDYPGRWRVLKAAFSRSMPKGERRSASRVSKGERGIWQRRYWEHTLRNETDVNRHIDYIHFSPVKHGHVERVVDWPYSTFHRYVALGRYPSDWGGGGVEWVGGVGGRC